MNPFAWTDYLAFAKTIRQDPGGETAERAAISRAYYACFGVASDWARTDGLVTATKGPGSHADVWVWFKRHRNTSLRPIGREGFRLKDYRVKADYNAVYPRVSDEATLALLLADQLMTRLDQL